MSISRDLLLNSALADRVAHLLDQMTLDEKLAQIVGVWVTQVVDEQHVFQEALAQEHLAYGIGHLTRVGAATFSDPRTSAALANRIQQYLVENTRLGIPAIVHEESCAGYMARDATTFPQAIGLGATFAPDLIEQMAAVIRQQMRAVGAHQALAPVLDVARDPRWGRIEETFGEDPFLTTQIGLAYVRGIQSDDLREGVAATAKHFVAHAVPEGGMNWAPVHVGPRELREYFVPPFKAVIDAGVASVMNAYHEMDGIPCGASREVLVDLLRDELGFKGVVSSDYFTLRTLVDYHRVACDAADAARLGLEAGVDVELPARDCYGEPLRQALMDGRIDMALLDASVARVLTLKLQLGLFENPYVDEGRVFEVYNTPEQRTLTRRLAEQSLVLLRNDGLLPLAPTLQRIAVIGPSADSARLMQGDYHYPAHLDHLVTNNVVSPDAPNPQQAARAAINWDDHLPASTTVLAGIRAAVSAETEVLYARGCAVNDHDTSGFDEAIAAATAADVAIVVVGDQSGLGPGCTVGESLDSASLMLPGAQQKLVEAIHATGTPVVLVLMTGRPYNLSWAAEHLPALIQAWLPAQEGGTALAGVLFGTVNPSGRLPVSFPRSVGQVPVFYNHKPSGGRSNWQGQYVDSPTTPLFAFGHGLSYTQFGYSDLQLSSAQIAPSATLTVSVRVQNTGQYAGEEVVQLYVADPVASVTRPVRQLKGFARVALQPGETRTVHFDLNARHLAFYDADMRYIVEPGTIRVMVGAASNDIRQQATVEVVGAVTPVEPVFTTPTRIE